MAAERTDLPTRTVHDRLAVSAERLYGQRYDCQLQGELNLIRRSNAARLMQKQRPMTREAILERINEIDHKFQCTEPWLHSMLSKLARERELLVEQANRQFKAVLKHEWR
jgi:hypothetical protein